MDHSSHQPGTKADCKQCGFAAYEPSWYATLLAVSERLDALAEESTALSA